MPPDGLSAASAGATIKTTKHNATSRGSILDTSDEITVPTSSRREPKAAQQAGAFGCAEIRHPVAGGKLTIFHLIAAESGTTVWSEGAPDVAGEPVLGRSAGRAGSDEGIRVDIPFAAGIIVAEHRGIGFGLLGQPERQIALDEAFQSFRHMRRRLEIIDDPFEAVHRCQILSPVQIIAADLHLLAGQMIPGEIQF